MEKSFVTLNSLHETAGPRKFRRRYTETEKVETLRRWLLGFPKPDALLWRSAWDFAKMLKELLARQKAGQVLPTSRTNMLTRYMPLLEAIVQKESTDAAHRARFKKTPENPWMPSSVDHSKNPRSFDGEFIFESKVDPLNDTQLETLSNAVESTAGIHYYGYMERLKPGEIGFEMDSILNSLWEFEDYAVQAIARIPSKHLDKARQMLASILARYYKQDNPNDAAVLNAPIPPIEVVAHLLNERRALVIEKMRSADAEGMLDEVGKQALYKLETRNPFNIVSEERFRERTLSEFGIENATVYTFTFS